ncbi:hypothetical protein PybrP1_009697 [[Pythium] brassicae (nom. inval.)]|nr:hypothetical protein PybrP1_009697 [[Pythium] brassicae (nom. inval.)]
MSLLSGPFSRPSPAAAGSSGSSFAAALRHRRKPKEPSAARLDPSATTTAGGGSDPDARMLLRSARSLHSSSTSSVAVSTAAAPVGGGAGYGSFAPLVTRLSRSASQVAVNGTAGVLEAIHTSAPTAVGSTLDTISEIAPPHVAVRYGDIIRLFARSRYPTGGADAGGYVGTFEIGKRFLAPKSTSKQGELACIPPILKSGTLLYRPSTFRIKSTCGLSAGTPVSYGDVVVLVDERGRVWNNKIGVGPTTKNGYFGPRDHNSPGEMFLAFYQLLDEENSSSSESSDEEDSFLSFSSIAKTTKTMAETTFGKPTQVEMNLAATALRTVGRVVYYGDRNVVIDVADSNRIRSKFNRVITHYRKNDAGLPVQGGYLRCDGRGKTILFELHGPPLPSIESIDISEEQADFSADGSIANDDDDDSGSTRLSAAAPSRRMSLAGSNAIKYGQPISIRNLRRSSTLSVQFSDGGLVQIPCAELTGSTAGESFYKLVLGGTRPARILVQSKRSQPRKRPVGFRETLQGTYKEIVNLSGFVVVTYSSGAYVTSRVFGSVVLLPAVYVGVTVAVAVLLVEIFFPGRIVATRKTAAVVEVVFDESDSIGDWEFALLALEASESESIKCASASQDELLKAAKKVKNSAGVVVPKSFLVAENGNAAKAAERYEATLAWRQEVNADAILAAPQLHYDTIKANYKQYLHKHDKLGHPVYFEKMASINIKQLQKSGVTQDDLFRHYLFAMEFTLKYAANQLCPCEACASSDTQKLCIILDARGIGMKDIGGEAFEFVRRCTSMMQKHYPQKSFKIFFVNVPSWFGMAWKGIKPLLNETTRAKTNILSESDTPGALLEVIDADNLPVEYGGKCACAGGCDENSAYQRIQRALVSCVLTGEPFNDAEHGVTNGGGLAARAVAMPTTDSAPPTSRRKDADVDELSELCLVQDSESLAKSIPPGSFRDEILKAGFLLKRSLRHKHFMPIWQRRFFVLHPESLRFGKSPDAEIFQIVSFTSDTVVRKTNKQNNSFELITPLMASNGHALLLYAPTPQLLCEWIDAITLTILKLAPRGSPTPRAARATVLQQSNSRRAGRGRGTERRQLEQLRERRALSARARRVLRGRLGFLVPGPQFPRKSALTTRMMKPRRSNQREHRSFWQAYPEACS